MMKIRENVYILDLTKRHEARPVSLNLSGLSVIIKGRAEDIIEYIPSFKAFTLYIIRTAWEISVLFHSLENVWRTKT